MIKKITEKKIESSILRWLNAQPGIFAFKVNTVGIWDPVKQLYRKNYNPYVIKGTHDIIGCCYGKFFSIEVKNEGKLTEDQYLFGLKVRENGGDSLMVARTLDHVIQWVKTFLPDSPFFVLGQRFETAPLIPLSQPNEPTQTLQKRKSKSPTSNQGE